MGREVLRVPEGFDWPVGRIWPGRMLKLCNEMEYVAKDLSSEESCNLCRKYAEFANLELTTWRCPKLPFCDPPDGPWYQMWETTTEGSPISPAFETPKELAQWLTDNEASASGSMTATYNQWLAFIRGPGWAPSMIVDPEHGVRSGVVAATDN